MRLIDADKLMESIRKALGIKSMTKSLLLPAERTIIDQIDSAPTVGGWIPFVKRQLTDDEKNTHPDWCYILEGSVPEDEEEILLYRPWKNSKGYITTMDQYMNNGTECYLDGAGDIENGMFWMSSPEPPKENVNGNMDF